MRRLGLGLAVALGLPAVAACPFSFPNEDHCTRQGGDSYCAGLGAGSFCVQDGCGAYDETTNITGCVDSLPDDENCYQPCGDGDCTATGTTGSMTMTTSTSESMTGSTTAVETDAETGSTTNATCDCTDDAPLCVEGQCVACGDDGSDGEATCAEQYPVDGDDARPYCFEGRCRACGPTVPFGSTDAKLLFNFYDDGCDAEAPSCDGETGTCFSCAEHSDCASGVCYLPPVQAADSWPEGYCVPLPVVYWADNGPAGDDRNDGSEDSPFGTIGRALAEVGTQPYGAVRIASGTYREEITLEGLYIVLRGDGPERPQIIAPSGSTEPLVRINGNSRVLFTDLEIKNSVAQGILAANGIFIFRNVVIANSSGVGFEVAQPEVDAANMALVGNDGAAFVSDGGEPRFYYSTMENNRLMGLGEELGVQCPADAGVVLEKCLTPGVTHSCAVSGTGTLTAALTEPLNADGYHLHIDEMNADITGEPGERLPAVDIDGESRVADPGSDYAGVDVLPAPR